MQLAKILERYGFTKIQAKVYLACLELGFSSVQRISLRANLSRSTVYEALDALRRRGLVSVFEKRNIKYFSAESPRKIVSESQGIAQMLKAALPHFEAIESRAGRQPIIRFFQGKQGMIAVLKEILREAKEIRCFSSAEDLFETLDQYFPKFVSHRIKKRIPVRAILRESKKARERKELGPQQLRTVKIIPSQYEHHGLIFIWQNKIAMFSFRGEMEVVVIESEELVSVQRAMFEYIWDSMSDED